MKKSVSILWRLFFVAIAVGLLIILLADLGALGKMPSLETLRNPSSSQSSQVYADDGTIIGKYYLEDRVNVEYRDISKNVINALVATEDERFYEHSGIDPRSLARAISSFGTKGGASTITMQTAKNLFTDDPSNNILMRIIQKIKESIIAVKLERNFTKNEILTIYLNTVAFSDNVYGIRNASKTFFSKEPDRISLEESAVLVGMVNAPTAYNPRLYPKRAIDRRNLVLDRMERNNYISKEQATINKQKPIQLNYRKLDQTTGLAPYFRMILGEELKKWCKEHKKANGDNYNLYMDGLKIYTTINPRMQLYAEEAVAKHMAYNQKVLNSQRNIKTGSIWKGHENVLEAQMKISDRWKNMKRENIPEDEIKKSFFVKTKMKVFAWNAKKSVDTVMTPYDSIKYSRQMLQAGFLAMDPLSGQVKAWVGGIDFKTYKYDHVNVNTKRQVGSTIKPLLYSLAIEDAGFTPNTTVVDVQQSFGSYGLVPATAASCTGQSMPMSEALALSRNCATAYILQQLGRGQEGAKRFVDFLKLCDVRSPIPAYPSIALGACEISLFEMMGAYSMFPGKGFNVKPMYITRIEDKNGNVLQTFVPQRKEVISDVTAYSITTMMQGVVQYGTGRRIWNYGVSGEIAGKTGTTNDNSDSWFMGFTPQLLCGVWTGCDDRFIRFSSTANGQGSAAALPIWAYFYDKVSADKNLPIDGSATFNKPEVMQHDINYDWINSVPAQLGAEGEDVGNGNAEDYGIYDNPAVISPEDISSEDLQPVKKDTARATAPSKNREKKEKNPAGKQPKAVMPKRGGA